jgi:hypothetical protein
MCKLLHSQLAAMAAGAEGAQSEPAGPDVFLDQKSGKAKVVEG